MGPTWGPSWTDRAQVGPMLAPWTLLSGLLLFSLWYMQIIGHVMAWRWYSLVFILHYRIIVIIQNYLNASTYSNVYGTISDSRNYCRWHSFFINADYSAGTRSLGSHKLQHRSLLSGLGGLVFPNITLIQVNTLSYIPWNMNMFFLNPIIWYSMDYLTEFNRIVNFLQGPLTHTYIRGSQVVNQW